MRVILLKDAEGAESYTDALSSAGHTVSFLPLLQFKSENTAELIEVRIIMFPYILSILF